MSQVAQTEAVSRHIPLRTTAVHHDPEAAARALQQMESEERMAQMKKLEWRKRAHVAGRLFVATMFLCSAIAKMANFGRTAEYIGSVGLAAPELLLAIVIGVELAGGALLAVGLKVRTVALVLAGHLAVVTVFALSDFSAELNRTFAVANLAFAGALLMLFANGAGALSVDSARRRKIAREELANA